jgi:hypothetical protein
VGIGKVSIGAPDTDIESFEGVVQTTLDSGLIVRVGNAAKDIIGGKPDGPTHIFRVVPGFLFPGRFYGIYPTAKCYQQQSYQNNQSFFHVSPPFKIIDR